MRIIDFSLMDFREALALQEQLVAAIACGDEEETLLLLQHPPVFTIGRGGNPANILDPSVRVEQINRGGDVTWHGPGQVVGYPLVNLGKRGRDLHRWLRFLEELLVRTLRVFGIDGQCRPGSTGVWTDRGKIAFIGVGVRRWITMHGFSLNVFPDLAVFSRINPCGLPGCPVTSMAVEGKQPPSERRVVLQLKNDFEPLLNKWLPIS
jgi:lipoyl(octanoyl) transferase